jgi:hypothetical protein
MIAAHLVSPATRSQVQELLAKGGDKNLLSIASWADEVILAAHNEGPLRGNQEAIEFNKKFPNSGMWHFVNLPLGTVSYEQASKFTSSDDIIDAISRCIKVLESPTAQPEEFTKVQALRLLVHFVADIHQPLHCGTGYYSFDGSGAAQLITSPTQAFGKPNDRGGNLLFYGADAMEQLHALWNRVIVEKVDDSTDHRALADFLTKNYLPNQLAKTPGDYLSWAETWSIDSVRIASLAYLGFAFGTPELDTDQNLVRIDIKLPANYLDNNKVYAAEQLTKAGVRLAQLLDSIKWQCLAKREDATPLAP